jgi:glutamate racemase
MAETPVPIGVFDSGVGGLSIFNAIRRELPFQPIIYLADQAHVPYGPRPLAQVRHLRKVLQLFARSGAGMIVVACNAASAAALHHLRPIFAPLRFCGYGTGC